MKETMSSPENNSENKLLDQDMIQKPQTEIAPSNYDEKGNATHYKGRRIDLIRMIEHIWGTEALMIFCEINEFKYRMRMGKKNPIDQEMVKAEWYAKMAKFLGEKEHKVEGVVHSKMYSEFLRELEDGKD